jgi:hypothetical protein
MLTLLLATSWLQVRPDRVQVGDFPEESIFDDDEEM